MKRIIYICAVLCPVFLTAQKPVPGEVQSKSIMISNVTIHIGDGTVIEKGEVGFRNGKIDLINDLNIPNNMQKAYDVHIDATGKHLYPGFILTNSTIGLR